MAEAIGVCYWNSGIKGGGFLLGIKLKMRVPLLRSCLIGKKKVSYELREPRETSLSQYMGFIP